MGDQNQPAIDAFTAAANGGDPAAMAKVMEQYARDDIVQEWPQSGERIRGKQAIERINEMYGAQTGTSPKLTFRRLTGEGDTRVIEATIDYGDGTPVSYVGIAELKDGKLAKMTEYFANPFEAPAWRADYVEKMEPVAAR